jgi:glycerol-3-phosphate acyltransferase PlsY
MIASIMISPWVVAAWCLAAYLIGGLPVGWLLVRRKRYGLDLRRFGTGNIGTSNVYRHAGIDVAVIVGPLQFLQGFAPVLASRLAGLPLSASMLIGVCAVAGNGWSVYMKFNGGRGVAVATGAVAGLSVAGLIALLMCFAGGAIRGRIALAVLVAFVLLPGVAFVFGGANGWIFGSGCLAILVLLLLRRLEGLPRDARVYGHFWRRVYQRLVFDERPGRPLMGPRTDQNADSLPQ